MALEENPLGVSRRTILSGIGATIGGSALLADVGNALPLGNTKYVGKSYDPLSDQEQADASADLTFTPFGIIGELSVAGFTIPLGEDKPLSRLDSKGNVDTYAFVKHDAEFTVRDRVGGEERNLPLRGRFDVVNGHIVGSLSRPTSKWGEISFTLVPEDEGLASDEVGKALGLKGKHEISLYDDSSAIPDQGIPTSNSIANAPAAGDVEPSMFLPRPPIGGGGSGDDGDDGSDGGDGGNGDDDDDDNDDGGGGGGSPDLDPEPDLIITYVGTNPTNPAVCTDLEVVFAVKNKGTAAAHDETCKIKADWLRSDELVSVAERGLKPGETEEHRRSIKAPYRPPDGGRHQQEIIVSVAGDPASKNTTLYPQPRDDVCEGDCKNRAGYLGAQSVPEDSWSRVNYTEDCEYFLGTAAKVDYASEDQPGPRVATEHAYQIAKDTSKRFYLEGAFETVPQSPIKDCHIDYKCQKDGGCWPEKTATAWQTSVAFTAEIEGETDAYIQHYWPDGIRDVDEGTTWRDYLSSGLEIVDSFVNHPLADVGLKMIGYTIQTADPSYEVTEEKKVDGEPKKVTWELPLPTSKDEREGSIHFPNRTYGDEGDETAVSFRVMNKESAGKQGTIQTKSTFKYKIGVYAWEQHSKENPPSCDVPQGNVITYPKDEMVAVTNTARYNSVARGWDNPCTDDDYDQ